MLLVLELAMLVAGLYALFTAKLPQFIIGKKYLVEGPAARLIGAVLIAPLPIAFGLGFLLGMFSGGDPVIAALAELVLVVAAAVVASVMARRMGQRVA